MSDAASPEPAGEPAVQPQRLNVATWRYQGERAEADRAYCARFGVETAPEPTRAPGGAYAYPLPAGRS
jgi:hypothetical protein